MAINLVSLVQQYLTPQMVGSVARAVGVNEAVAQKLVAAALPAILAALATAAAAPGGAQKVSDAISNSDPDLLTKLSSAMTGGNTRFLNDGANLLSGLLGGGGLASLTGALSQYSGAPHPATQSLIGAAANAAIGTIGQQDPSNWSDPSAILGMLNSQKGAIAAALPGELSKALGASGLLAGLGGMATAATRQRRPRFRAPQPPRVRLPAPPPGARRRPPPPARAASRCGRSFSSSSSCWWRSTGS